MKSWVVRGFDRGIILEILKTFHESSIASVPGVMMLLAMVDMGQPRRELTINLKTLAKSGYVQLYTAAEFPEHLASLGREPDEIVGVRILPKGISWAEGVLPVDPEVLR